MDQDLHSNRYKFKEMALDFSMLRTLKETGKEATADCDSPVACISDSKPPSPRNPSGISPSPRTPRQKKQRLEEEAPDLLTSPRPTCFPFSPRTPTEAYDNVAFPSHTRRDLASSSSPSSSNLGLIDAAIAHSLDAEVFFNAACSPSSSSSSSFNAAPGAAQLSDGGWRRSSAHVSSQFNSSSRERSPGSHSALLDLLNRYPSARSSAHSAHVILRSASAAPHIPITAPAPLHFRPTVDAVTGQPSVELHRSASQSSAFRQPDFPHWRQQPTHAFSLDAFVDEVLGTDAEMNRSTSQWRSSFNAVQEKFEPQQQQQHQQYPQQHQHHLLQHHHPQQQQQHYQQPQQHRPQQNGAPPTQEFYRSPQITSYWERTLSSSRPSLTAAERLQMLHEDPNEPPRAPLRKGSGEALAARRAQFQREAERVHAGVARFPIGELSLSPPPARPKLHSPSPDQLSESSSIYQMPTGLPHPKPKHNIKEQIFYAGLQTNTLPRSGLRTSPHFPSVFNRISEFEGRPGTPTLQLGGSSTSAPSTPIEPGPLSPRTTVYRNQPPIIQLEMGNAGRSTPIPRAFDFPEEPPIPKVVPTPVSPATPLNSSTSFPFNHVPGKLLFPSSPSPPPPKTAQHSVPVASPASAQQPFHAVHETQKKDLAINGPAANGAHHHIVNGRPPAPSDPMTSSIYESVDLRVTTPRSVRRPQPRVNVPKFYFPQGKPVSQHENDVAMRRALDVFRKLPAQKASFDEFEDVVRAAGLPLYWKKPIYDSITNGKNVDVSQMDFSAWWRNMTSVANDEAARFVYTLSGGKKDYLERKDFQSLCYDVIYTHPGLAFYHSASEFHPSYVDVVTTRIFWNVNRSWTNKITAQELRRSDFLEQLQLLEREDDINKETRYFSYEHFYVIYCKFWELDDDHDMLITKRDLLAHDEGALTPLIVDRIFSRAVVKPSQDDDAVDVVGLPDFAAFLLADEDKKAATSVEYWFRVCDLDGDGLITLFEMEEMYNQVRDKLTFNKIDTMQFSDVACNLIDMIRPKNQNGFTLSDLKKCPLAYRFFNSFTNWRKFFNQEINEGEKPVVRNDEGRELSEWERYCAEEYESLMEAEAEDQVDETHSVNLDDEETRNSFRDLL